VIFESRREAGRWTVAFAVVLGLHAVPVAIALYWLAPRVAAKPAEPAILIDMAPLATPPVPPSEQTPGPKQVQAEAATPRVRQEEIRTPPVTAPAVALPMRPPEPPREDKPPAPQTTAPPSRPAPPAAAASSAAPTWQGLVLGQLNKSKRYPPLAQSRRQQGAPWIRFVIDREGRVLSSRLERTSGIASLDQEAVSLPRRAQPLPKPPAEVPGQTIELVVPVEFFIR